MGAVANGKLDSYSQGTSSVPLLGETIGAALNRAAASFPSRDALVVSHQNIRYSYEELLYEVNRAARALLALGVQRGDRIGIWSPNVAEWMITQYAAAKVGAILVNQAVNFGLLFGLGAKGLRGLQVGVASSAEDGLESRECAA